MSIDPRLPNYTRPEVEEAAPDVALVHDLLAGTRRMHARATTYIRKWADEEPSVYAIRRACETVFEGLGRTLSAATGMLFAKAPGLEWNQSETAMAEHWANVDAAGAAGPVFVKRFAEAALRDGIGILLVDHPTPPEGVTITAANERSLGLRPTWAMYGRAQARSWRTAIVNNRRQLVQLVLHERAELESDVFGIAHVDRYRVLALVGGVATWRVFQAKKADADKIEDFEIVGSGLFRNTHGRVADFLPVAIGYTGRTDAPMTATIPLLGVAWANLAHWQQSTNLRFYRELCAFPQPTVVGALAPDPQTGAAGTLRVGPMVAVHLTEVGASFAWTELDGSSMAQLERGIDEKLGQMSKLGMAFLATDTRAAETAEAKRLDATAENSTLATAAQGIEDAVNLACEFHAWYLGIEKAGAPVMSISRDYESTAMDAATMTAYANAVAGAGLPIRLLLEAWQDGGRIGPDEDLETLELEIEARRAADAERERQAADDRAREAAESTGAAA
ncbi:MAG: DUF4055 domain-containing protein [Gemmatimonadaceae bacterium]|nr:DUF4055 domain-containing protein [Gemmatimonadaceae bacterium]